MFKSILLTILSRPVSSVAGGRLRKTARPGGFDLQQTQRLQDAKKSISAYFNIPLFKNLKSDFFDMFTKCLQVTAFYLIFS